MDYISEIYRILREYQDGDRPTTGVCAGKLDVALTRAYDELIKVTEAATDEARTGLAPKPEPTG